VFLSVFFVFFWFLLENLDSTNQESTMQKYGQKAPVKANKAGKKNRQAATMAGIRVSGTKPAYPPK